MHIGLARTQGPGRHENWPVNSVDSDRIVAGTRTRAFQQNSDNDIFGGYFIQTIFNLHFHSNTENAHRSSEKRVLFRVQLAEYLTLLVSTRVLVRCGRFQMKFGISSFLLLFECYRLRLGLECVHCTYAWMQISKTPCCMNDNDNNKGMCDYAFSTADLQ